MKKLILLLLFTISITFAFANDVSMDVASNKAQELMADRIPAFTGTVSSITPVQYNGKNAYYVVQFAPEGWILISADDKSEPLLGYSDTGVFQTKLQPENISSFLDGCCKRIERNSVDKDNVASGWSICANAKSSASTRATSSTIEPLIKVNWNQSSPYNKYCPSDNAHGQAIVGCVAVAMAQAMSVAQYPSRPNGEYSYTSANYGSIYINYDKESAYNWSNILSGANSKDDVAHLLYHCGVSLNMDYGSDGSGTQDSYIAKALQRNFSYSSSVKYYKRSNYTESWEELIYNELKNGRAVCLSGQDLKGGYGHCFNLDGYSGGAYHVNWGWGGANNGYFTLDALKDNTMNMDYSDPDYQSVIVGIRAPSENPSDILLSNYTVMEGLAAGAVVGTITVESEAVNPTYTYKLVGEYSPVLHTYLKAPFNVVDGKLVTTESLSSSNITITITATNQNNASVSRDFTIQVLASGTGIKENTVKTLYTNEYFNVTGEKMSEPQRGLNIVKRTYSDGTIEVYKKLLIVN